MTIDKLPSGKYRIRHTENKHTYSLTTPVKPTTREAWDLIYAKMTRASEASITLEEAAAKYIKSKSNVLSPATLRAYDTFSRTLPDSIRTMDIKAIDDFTIQNFINNYAKDHKPKTVNNMYSFVLSAIRLFYPKTVFYITLPQKARVEAYTPSVDDVKRIFEYSKNSEYYVALRLASMSLRLSEICALTLDDLDGDKLTINKAYVQGINGYTLKNVPKTDASNRTIVIPKDLADHIRKQGYIYNKAPKMVYYYLSVAQAKLGIPHFGIHKLRHFFASYAHELGYTDAQIQEIGGWSTDHVMKTVYRHAMEKDEAKKQIASDFDL